LFPREGVDAEGADSLKPDLLGRGKKEPRREARQTPGVGTKVEFRMKNHLKYREEVGGWGNT